MTPKAFVTGGTGFIGLNLIRCLSKRNWSISALHRKASDLSYITRFPVKLSEGSVTDYSSLLQSMPERTDVVFHLAGDTNLWSRYNARQKSVNVDGTRNVMNAAIKKRAQVFIYTSSASAWGDMSGKHVNERLDQKGSDSWVNYERTKWAAEQEILHLAPAGMKVVILNPTTVTGPYDKNNWGRLFFALRDGDLPGIPDGIVSVTHVEEVARAHIAAIEKGKSGERYILAGEDCRFSNFVGEIAAISNIEKIPGKIPTSLLKILARFSLISSSITGKDPNLTPELVKLMTRTDLTYSSRKAIENLDYKVTPMKKSVFDCYHWLKKEGYL